MKKNEFIKAGRMYILHAFLLLKGESKAYTSPFFIWASVPTLPYMLHTILEYDEQEIQFWDYQRKEPYLSISMCDVTEIALSIHARTAGRIHGSYYVVIQMKAALLDFEIETLDIFEVLHICKACKQKGVIIQDPYGVIGILMGAYKKRYVYQEFMERSFSSIADKYHIKYPVISYEREHKKSST